MLDSKLQEALQQNHFPIANPTSDELLASLPEFVRGGKLGLSMDQKLNIKKYGGCYYVMYSRDGWKGDYPKVQVSDRVFIDALAKTWLELKSRNLLPFTFTPGDL